MELIISIIAVIISFVTFLYTVLVEYRGEQREKKQSTLEALNLLQEQVFDKLNEYTFAEIKDISDKWNESAEEKRKFVTAKKGTATEFWNTHHEYDNTINEYRVLSGYLARIEHFSLGVNTGIYDVKVTERAATSDLTMLYKKLEPLILTKNNSNNSSYENKYHKEFGKLVTALTKLEA